MGFVITNPLIPQFKNEEERNNFIANHTPGELRKLGFFGRSMCGYNEQLDYDMYSTENTKHRIFGDT